MIFTWLKLVMVVTAAVVIQQLQWTVSDIGGDDSGDDGGDDSGDDSGDDCVGDRGDGGEKGDGGNICR